MEKEKAKYIVVQIDPEVRHQLKIHAVTEQLSMSEMIKKMILVYEAYQIQKLSK